MRDLFPKLGCAGELGSEEGTQNVLLRLAQQSRLIEPHSSILPPCPLYLTH